MLLVVIGYRQKGWVSKSRVGGDTGPGGLFLLSQGLIYCDPARELNFWRPTPSALLAPVPIARVFCFHRRSNVDEHLERSIDAEAEVTIAGKKSN